MSLPFSLVKDAETNALGTDPIRFFEFGHAPDECETPYATWQVMAAEPLNVLCGAPTYDLVEAQIDIWATDAAEARTAARAIRRAIDKYIRVTHYLSGHDEESDLYRITCRCNYLEEIDHED